MSSHDDDPNKQSELIDAAISNGAKAIILDNAGADASIGRGAEGDGCRHPRVPDRPRDQRRRYRQSQIVANNAQGAAAVAEEFVAALPNGGNYIELTGKESDTNAGFAPRATRVSSHSTRT